MDPPFGVAIRSMREEGRVFLDEFLLVFRDILQGVNRVGSASRNTGAAVNATLGIDKHLSRSFKAGFVLLRVDAVGWANVDAKRIFDARISNYISHGESISTR